MTIAVSRLPVWLQRAPARTMAHALIGASLMTAAVCASAAPQQYPSEKGTVQVTELAQDLERPWGLAVLPDGAGLLISERPGRLRLWRPDGGLVQAPITGVPTVFARGQGGLLDVVLSPDFANDRFVYMSYAEAGDGDRAGTAVGRGRLSADATALEDFQVIFRQEPKLSTGNHFGSRLVFDRDGYLFIALGENNERIASQHLDKLQGKVVRIYPDGRIPDDNPYVGKAEARPEIWSYGHRNPQGAALDPRTGTLWVNEHGPRGGDEINLPQAGKNYGWPLATHGVNYSGLAIPEAVGTSAPGTEAPHQVWKVSPGVSGMAFLSQDGGWKDNAFIGALVSRNLIRLELDGDRVVHEERLLNNRRERIRDVRASGDGALYLLTDDEKGKLLRVELVQ